MYLAVLSKRPQDITELVMFFFLISGVSGYVSNSMYKQLNGERWAWNLVLTASLFSGYLWLFLCKICHIDYNYNSIKFNDNKMKV